MLSYQHGYHAGNLADLHKHALLARVLAHMTDKAKPLTYIETHAGRGLYDLNGEQARKTGEAAAGITRALRDNWLDDDHPLLTALNEVRAFHGPDAYPGSPLIALHFLRHGDSLHLAELHPAEYAALNDVVTFGQVHRCDGFAMAQAICPPTPRRGLMLIDPSYEVKDDYIALPRIIAQLSRKWNVGVIALWYPVLRKPRHTDMIAQLTAAHPDALLSELRFPPVQGPHHMIGSGMFVINPPWGLDDDATSLRDLFARIADQNRSSS